MSLLHRLLMPLASAAAFLPLLKLGAKGRVQMLPAQTLATGGGRPNFPARVAVAAYRAAAERVGRDGGLSFRCDFAYGCLATSLYGKARATGCPLLICRLQDPRARRYAWLLKRMRAHH